MFQARNQGVTEFYQGLVLTRVWFRVWFDKGFCNGFGKGLKGFHRGLVTVAINPQQPPTFNYHAYFLLGFYYI